MESTGFWELGKTPIYLRLNYKIYRFREKYISLINTYANKNHLNLTENKENLTIIYKPNIRAKSMEEYGEKFMENISDDLKYFRTTSGSQRDEIDIIINGKDTKIWISRSTKICYFKY